MHKVPCSIPKAPVPKPLFFTSVELLCSRILQAGVTSIFCFWVPAFYSICATFSILQRLHLELGIILVYIWLVSAAFGPNTLQDFRLVSIAFVIVAYSKCETPYGKNNCPNIKLASTT